MLTKELLERLGSYIKIYWLDSRDVCCSIDVQARLEKKLAAAKETFAEYLLRYMHERGANEVDVYKRAQLDRRVFSKLRTNRNYKPHKRTLLAIAFGLELNLEEAMDLLDRAGYSFSEFDKEDIIAAFFFEENIHDLFTVNEALDRYGFKPLGS